MAQWARGVVLLVVAAAAAGCVGNAQEEGRVTDVTFVSVPDEGDAGNTIVVCWRVDGSGTVPHAAVHTDVESRPRAYVFTEYVGASFYPGNASTPGPHVVPATFCTGVDLPDAPGDLYLRAHAFGSDGPPGIMSPVERAVRVVAAGTK